MRGQTELLRVRRQSVEVDLALSQIVTQCQVQVRNMPPGTFPPQVLKYDAASVPVLQLGLSSPTLAERPGRSFMRQGPSASS